MNIDPQSAFCSMLTIFPDAVLDVGGAKDYASKIYAKIYGIKNIYRSVKSSLLWPIPSVVVRPLL